MEPGEPQPAGIPIGGDDPNSALRFEDLTIDDDLPLLDRVVRYCRSGIALQRLVHVKMLAETAETVGMGSALATIVPLLNPLISDPESIIRQHLASQLLPLSIACMVEGIGPLRTSVSEVLSNPGRRNAFNEQGYAVVASTVVSHLNTLITDADMDVRRSASESLAGLAVQIKKEDVGRVIVPVPLRLASETKPKKGTPDGFHEELRITSANLLAELSGSAESGLLSPEVVQEYVMPAVLRLCTDISFRVRRGAAQALPRVLGGSSLNDVQNNIVPAFENLSRDDMYRVRKSTGECLVDMSRSLMILASKPERTEEEREMLKGLRRSVLIPIAIQLLEDANKFVRHGMMQFLGPFIASFYPLEDGALNAALPDGNESVPAENSGIGSQFFPHASSMVSRLNSSASATPSSPTPTPATLNVPEPVLSETEQLHRSLPLFLRSNRLSYLSLESVVSHRRLNPPDAKDVDAVKSQLLVHFVSLSRVDTGDENTDAEMRVYCAYSYPAVVLLLGRENWDGDLKNCFMTLVNPNYGKDDANDIAIPPLPVKRCLASSLHTVAHILGSELTLADILPVFQQHFFRDTDDSVRLNVIRNFPWLLSLLPQNVRSDFLSTWSEIVRGEDLLGAHKRSVTNPMLLNWRQRDCVSRSIPDLLGLVDPEHVHRHLWPVLQMLLVDTVSLVREDAEWSIPLLLRAYCAENLVPDVGGPLPMASKRWSADTCQEVVAWLKETILGVPSRNAAGKGENGRSANFGRRQLYCRICEAVGLALRFGDLADDQQWDCVYHDMLNFAAEADSKYSPYKKLGTPERKHLRRLLVYDLLPPALEMKDDRVTNVRLTLMKVLKRMPSDIKDLAAVSEVLQELEDEVETWESFNGAEPKAPPPSEAPQAANAAAERLPRTDREPKAPPEDLTNSEYRAAI